jgi:hypothetical protein
MASPGGGARAPETGTAYDRWEAGGGWRQLRPGLALRATKWPPLLSPRSISWSTALQSRLQGHRLRTDCEFEHLCCSLAARGLRAVAVDWGRSCIFFSVPQSTDRTAIQDPTPQSPKHQHPAYLPRKEKSISEFLVCVLGSPLPIAKTRRTCLGTVPLQTYRPHCPKARRPLRCTGSFLRLRICLLGCALVLISLSSYDAL